MGRLVLIVVLLLIWIGALAPMIYRRYRARQAAVSVDQFHYRTWLFRRAYPAVAITEPTPCSPQRAASQLKAEKLRIRRRRERRRRVLVSLGGAIVGTLLFGAMPPLRGLWDLTIVLLLVGVGYVVLAATAARDEVLALERMRKVIPLERSDVATAARASAVAVGGRRSFAIAPLPQRPAFVLVDAPRA